MNRKNRLQPWRISGISLAFFSLLLPKIPVCTGIDGAVGILMATVFLCILHRVGQGISGKRICRKNGAIIRIGAAFRFLWYVVVFVGVCFFLGCFMQDCFWLGMSETIAFYLVMAMLFPALSKGKQLWQRMLAVSVIWILPVLLGLPALAVGQAEHSYMNTATVIHPTKAGIAGGIYLCLSWYLLLIPKEKHPGMWPDSTEGLYLINGIVLSAICMLMGMVYGPYSAMKRRWPMLSLLQGVSVPGEFMERVDIVWATVAAVALFMGLGVLLSHCRQAFCTMLGVKEILQPLRYKGLLSFGILVIVVSITGYKGVQAQDRLYVSTFFADVDKQGYVFYFSGQNPEDAIYAVHAKDIKAAVENYTLHEQKQPNFGHIEATVLSDKLLMDRQATKDLFRALAAWQDFAENSYVYRCDAPKKLFTADTGDTVPGVYLAGLYDDHPERKGEKTVLRQLLSAWLNGRYTERIPRILVDDSGQITVSTAADS